MAPRLSPSSVVTAFGVLAAGLIIRFIVLLCIHRRRMRDLVNTAIFGHSAYDTNNPQPKPPWDPIFGNLPIMGKASAAFPPRTHPHAFPHWIRQQHPDLPPVFYLDLW